MKTEPQTFKDQILLVDEAEASGLYF